MKWKKTQSHVTFDTKRESQKNTGNRSRIKLRYIMRQGGRKKKATKNL